MKVTVEPHLWKATLVNNIGEQQYRLTVYGKQLHLTTCQINGVKPQLHFYGEQQYHLAKNIHVVESVESSSIVKNMSMESNSIFYMSNQWR